MTTAEAAVAAVAAELSFASAANASKSARLDTQLKNWRLILVFLITVNNNCSSSTVNLQAGKRKEEKRRKEKKKKNKKNLSVFFNMVYIILFTLSHFLPCDTCAFFFIYDW